MRCPAPQASRARSSFSVKKGGRSGPSATRAAPVRVAKSTSSSGLPSPARVSASARISRPSASVLPISTVRPLRLRMTSPGRNEADAMAFSTIGRITRSRRRKPASMIICARARAVAAPPMSFFISSMPASGLMFSPPVSKVTPLPTRVTAGASAAPQVNSTSRGGWWPACPTAWISGKPTSRSAPDHLRERRAIPFGQLPGRGRQSLRAEVVGGRVDEVAAKRDRSSDSLDARGIHIAWGAQPWRLGRRRLFIPGEPVDGERPGQGGDARFGHFGREPVVAFRQQCREPADGKAIGPCAVRVVHAEQNDGGLFSGSGQQGVTAGLGFEADGARLLTSEFGQSVPGALAHGDDRNRLRRRRGEGECHAANLKSARVRFNVRLGLRLYCFDLFSRFVPVGIRSSLWPTRPRRS